MILLPLSYHNDGKNCTCVKIQWEYLTGIYGLYILILDIILRVYSLIYYNYIQLGLANLMKVKDAKLRG